jgi:hypothetical protein
LDNSVKAKESRKMESPFNRKRQTQQFSSLMRLSFSEDKRQKLPPPQRSVMNGLFILLSLHISLSGRGGVVGVPPAGRPYGFSQIIENYNFI